MSTPINNKLFFRNISKNRFSLKNSTSSVNLLNKSESDNQFASNSSKNLQYLMTPMLFKDKIKKVSIYPQIETQKNSLRKSDSFNQSLTERKFPSSNSIQNLNMLKFKKEKNENSKENDEYLYSPAKKNYKFLNPDKFHLKSISNNNLNLINKKFEIEKKCQQEEESKMEKFNNKLMSNRKSNKRIFLYNNSLAKENSTSTTNSNSHNKDNTTLFKNEELNIDTPEELHFMQVNLCKQIKKLNMKFENL